MHQVQKLSTQDFAEVLSAMRRLKNEATELRTATRVGVGAKATVWWIDNGRAAEASWVHVEDLSLTGAGLITTRALGNTEPFILGLPRARREPLLVECQAAHVRELADGVYRVGARFGRTLQRGGETPTKPVDAPL
jgi:hypothetical protein